MNKLKVGDKVVATKNFIKGNVKNICNSYCVGNTGEFELTSYPDVAFFFDAYCRKVLPVGEVVGYGAEVDKKKFLEVVFRSKYGILRFFASEGDDVRKFKK